MMFSFSSDKYYFLRHRNTEVALLSFDEESGSLQSVMDVYVPELLPLGFSGTTHSLGVWWSERTVPMTRYGVQQVLVKLGKQTTSALLLDSYGLSLTDHYWVVPTDEVEKKWEQMNFFFRDFSEDIGDLFVGQDTVANSPLSPSTSASGEMRKRWFISNGDRYLLKVTTSNFGQQCVNEVIASEMHRLLGFENYVPYFTKRVAVDNNPSALGCYCKAFTSELVEFVPAYHVIKGTCKRNNESYFEALIRFAEKAGIEPEALRAFLEYMIVTDYLLSNVDRHYNNFGFLRSEGVKLTGIAPLFDSGNSLFFNTAVPDKYTKVLGKPFNKFGARQLKHVRRDSQLPLQKLSSLAEFSMKALEQCYGMPTERKDLIVGTLVDKIALLDDFYNGFRVWEERRFWNG